MSKVKKTIYACIVSMILTLIPAVAGAVTISGDVEPIDTPVNGLTNIYEDYYTFDYNGQTYYFKNNFSYSRPRIYDEKAVDFFVKEVGTDLYTKAGNIYMAAVNEIPYEKVFAGGDSWKGYGKFYIRFYDENFNLLNEIKTGEYIESIWSKEGKYYWITEGDGYNEWCTEDMQKWQRMDVRPGYNKIISDTIYIFENRKYKVSFDNGETFSSVVGEADLESNTASRTDIPLILKNRIDIHDHNNNVFYISKDGINYIRIKIDNLNFNISVDHGYYKSPLKQWYIADNRFIIETDIERLSVPMDTLNSALDELRNNSPYIKLNDTYLAFEESPVIENGTTLVPMRFLFEQMGANVEWDQETQTATAKKDSKTVAFSVGNTNASVNGTAKTMAVPAQLVNDKTMIPLRFLSENLGYKVTWDNETRTASITTAE